uniref:Uncharacterized protein n=1 Tax=Guillardia theta TaxID=55529 RepID=A0A7S4JVR5_GUITH|mmetsp:Transcript_19102/g.62967  ORF Transcript_19102/g.62967 Transcript_19102/m.62967 type:complete len:313 (+) Transcript_19102:887-1825(+)
MKEVEHKLQTSESMREVNVEELEKARQDNQVLQQKNEILSNVLESLQEDMRGLQVEYAEMREGKAASDGKIVELIRQFQQEKDEYAEAIEERLKQSEERISQTLKELRQSEKKMSSYTKHNSHLRDEISCLTRALHVLTTLQLDVDEQISKLEGMIVKQEGLIESLKNVYSYHQAKYQNLVREYHLLFNRVSRLLHPPPSPSSCILLLLLLLLLSSSSSSFCSLGLCICISLLLLDSCWELARDNVFEICLPSSSQRLKELEEKLEARQQRNEVMEEKVNVVKSLESALQRAASRIYTLEMEIADLRSHDCR